MKKELVMSILATLEHGEIAIPLAENKGLIIVPVNLFTTQIRFNRFGEMQSDVLHNFGLSPKEN